MDEMCVVCIVDEVVVVKLLMLEDKEDWGFICECFYIIG